MLDQLIGGIQAIIGLLLIFIVPGYILSLFYFKNTYDSSLIERACFSVILSFITVLLSIIFLDLILGIDTKIDNIYMFLLLIVLFLIILYFLVKFIFSNKIIIKKVFHLSEKINSLKICIQENLTKYLKFKEKEDNIK